MSKHAVIRYASSRPDEQRIAGGIITIKTIYARVYSNKGKASKDKSIIKIKNITSKYSPESGGCYLSTAKHQPPKQSTISHEADPHTAGPVCSTAVF